MEISIENVSQFVISELRDAQASNSLHNSRLTRASYDVFLGNVVSCYMSKNGIDDPDAPGSVFRNDSYQEQERRRLLHKQIIRYSCETLWNLCRQGVLRPGANHGNGGSMQDPERHGFSVTLYGEDWLRKYSSDHLPFSQSRMVAAFSEFESQFGMSYFRRCKEAIDCYHAGTYLACCVMSGAATESILLSAAFAIHNKEDVIKMYKTSNGRTRVTNLVFGKSKLHIKDTYVKYLDILNYWRDESGHGHESDIDVNQAYISLLTLLRFAEFMRDHWQEITA